MSLNGLMKLSDLQDEYFFRLPHAKIIADYVWPGVIMSPQRVIDIKDIEFEADDIVIASYPKSGTTWMAELVSAMVFGGDTELLSKIPQEERVPWLELENNYWWVKISNFCNRLFPRGKSMKQVSEMVASKNPRHVCFTHLPLELLPKSVLEGKCRLIYVARNPKDNAVSFFHFHRMSRFLGRQENLSWNDFFALHITGSLYCGSWFEHVLGYWNFANGNDKVMFVKYEELKQGLDTEIRKIAKFLDIDLDDEQVKKVAQHCTFDSMKKNKMANRDFWLLDQTVSKFMRKGEIGDWKNYFTFAQSETFDALYKEKIAGSGLEFQFD